MERSIDYDFEVVENWIKYLKDYLGENYSLKDKVILELGPGPSLGTGLILLAMGIRRYIALDVNELAKGVSPKFYKALLARIKDKYPNSDIGYLTQQLEGCYKGEASAMSYIVDKF